MTRSITKPDANHSWNCGTEGPSEDEAVSLLRSRQMKNLLALTLLSAGTPMLLMGDEGRRTQGGNNNAYCQNNETSWLDWSLNCRNEELQRFVACLIRLRFGSEVSSDSGRLSLEQYEVEAHYQWHGIELGKPDWKDDSHAIAFTLHTSSLKRLLYVAVNAFWGPLSFALPASRVAGPLGWQRLVGGCTGKGCDE
jgi:isoamylase